MRLFLSLLCCLVAAPFTRQALAQNIDSLTQVVLAMPDDSAKINQLGMWGSRLRGRAPEASIRLIDSAYAISTRLNYPKFIGLSLNELGLSYNERGEWDRAEQSLLKSIDVFNSIPYERGVAKALNNLGNIYNARGQLEKALGCYLQSLEIKERTGEKGNLGVPIGNIGLLFMNMSQYEKAIEYLRRAEALHEHNEDSLQLVVVYHNLGLTFLHMGDPPKAIGYFLKEIQISRLQGNLYGLMVAYENIAEAYTARGEHTKALDYLNKAYDLALQLNHINEQVRIVNQRAGVRLALEKPSQALFNELEANERSASVLGFKAEQKNAWKMLANAHRQAGHKSEAKACEARAEALEQELNGVGQAERMLDMEGKYQQRKAE